MDSTRAGLTGGGGEVEEALGAGGAPLLLPVLVVVVGMMDARGWQEVEGSRNRVTSTRRCTHGGVWPPQLLEWVVEVEWVSVVWKQRRWRGVLAA